VENFSTIRNILKSIRLNIWVDSLCPPQTALLSYGYGAMCTSIIIKPVQMLHNVTCDIGCRCYWVFPRNLM